MLMKLVTLLASSFVLTAFAGEAYKPELCNVGHDKFIATAPKGFKVETTKNEKTGSRITSIQAPDGSAIAIITIPASQIPAFKGLPMEHLGVQCISPLGGLNEVFAVTDGPTPVKELDKNHT